MTIPMSMVMYVFVVLFLLDHALAFPLPLASPPTSSLSLSVIVQCNFLFVLCYFEPRDVRPHLA